MLGQVQAEHTPPTARRRLVAVKGDFNTRAVRTRRSTAARQVHSSETPVGRTFSLREAKGNNNEYRGVAVKALADPALQDVPPPPYALRAALKGAPLVDRQSGHGALNACRLLRWISPLPVSA